MPDVPPLTRTQLRCLADWLPILEAPDFSAGEWRGGTAGADGVIHMPWFEYSEAMAGWPGPCEESLIVMGFAWPAWLETPEGRALARNTGAIASATSADLARLVTAIVRSDRFTEGSLAGAAESGLLLAISRRAAALLAG